ncbi:MAG: MBL fold metallo-hydrolase [Betaproteobacteria bacterium]|nr:MBL fold metallo-hydrolase [Betaproteobacteria bacterium]
MPHIIDYDFGISAIDSGFHRPMLAAIHLIVEDGRAAIIDTGSNHSVGVVMQALAAKGLKPEQVDWVILTHIHLDHAGGASQLMRLLPEAVLTVHPRGARHMADPGRLVQGAIDVYGAEVTRQTYGEILPIPKERILETPHESSIRLNSRELVFLDTPGHARHHVAIHDLKSGHVFSGDTFGLSYREIDCHGMQFVVPTSSPVQFDPEAYHRSIDLMAGKKPRAIYLTHFSQVREITRLASDLHRLVDAHAALALREKDAGPERPARLEAGVTEIVLGEAQRYRWTLPRQQLLEVYGLDIGLNAQGLGIWLDAAGSA